MNFNKKINQYAFMLNNIWNTIRVVNEVDATVDLNQLESTLQKQIQHRYSGVSRIIFSIYDWLVRNNEIINKAILSIKERKITSYSLNINDLENRVQDLLKKNLVLENNLQEKIQSKEKTIKELVKINSVLESKLEENAKELLNKDEQIKDLKELYHSQLESSKQNTLLTKTISWLNDPTNQSAMQKKGVGQQAAHVDSAVRLLTDWKNQTEAGKAVSLPKYYHATGKTNPKTISLILTSGEILVSDKGSMGPGAFISTHDEYALYGPEKEKPAFTIALTQKVESIAARYFPVNPKRTKAHLANYDHGLWIAVDKNISLQNCGAYIITDDNIASDHAALDEYVTKEQRSKIPVVARSVADIVRYALDANAQPEPKPTQWHPCAGPGCSNFFLFEMPATKNWPKTG